MVGRGYYGLPCILHDRGGFVLHSAHATEVWLSLVSCPGPAFSAHDPTERERQMIADMAVANYSKATPPSSMLCPPSRRSCGTPQARGLSRQILSEPLASMKIHHRADLFARCFLPEKRTQLYEQSTRSEERRVGKECR